MQMCGYADVQIKSKKLLMMCCASICTFAHLKFAHWKNARNRTILPLAG